MTGHDANLAGLVSTMLTRHPAAANVDDMPEPRARRFAKAARALLRDTLFDAASELLEQRSWSETRMADIAKTAGVSRQTLYKEFGSRQGFAQAYILREAERFLADVQEAVAKHENDPKAALAAAVDVFLTTAADEPLIMAIVRGDAGDGLLAYVTNQAGPVLNFATQRLGDILSENWPKVPAHSVTLIAENMIRLAISHAASSTASAAEVADGMAELFGPYLYQVVGAPGR